MCPMLIRVLKFEYALMLPWRSCYDWYYEFHLLSWGCANMYLFKQDIRRCVYG